MRKKSHKKTPIERSAVLPLIITSVLCLAIGFAGYYMLGLDQPVEETNDIGAAVLSAGIVLSGIFAIAAWTKR